MPVWSESSAPNSALDDKISFVVQNNTDYVFLGVWDNPSNGWFSRLLGTNEDGNEIFDVSSNGGSEVFGGISNHGLKERKKVKLY